MQTRKFDNLICGFYFIVDKPGSEVSEKSINTAATIISLFGSLFIVGVGLVVEGLIWWREEFPQEGAIIIGGVGFISAFLIAFYSYFRLAKVLTCSFEPGRIRYSKCVAVGFVFLSMLILMSSFFIALKT